MGESQAAHDPQRQGVFAIRNKNRNSLHTFRLAFAGTATAAYWTLPIDLEKAVGIQNSEYRIQNKNG